MKKFSIALLAMAAALAITPAALADSSGPISVGAPGSSPTDFSQEFCEGGGVVCGAFNGNFNNMEVFIETPGVFFSGAGTLDNDGYGAPDVGTNWSSTLGNSQYIQFTTTTLDQIDALAFTLYFAQDVPFTVDFYATEGGTVVDSALLTYGDGSWTGGDLDPANIVNENTTPEPSSLLLLGTGLLGLAFVVFRKAKPSGGLVLHS